jgi:16S rRNA (adenine(1408)-N(1))-methyltransferase
LPWTRAHETPERFFVGLDANAANLSELSGRAARERLTNLLYVRAAVESLPVELAGIADQVTVVLPWGSLLAAIALPRPEVLRGIGALCQPGARLTVVLGSDPARDRAELQRLGISSLQPEGLASRLALGYGEAGWTLETVRALEPSGLARWPSTWTSRLARGDGRAFVELEAVVGSAGGRAG